MKPAASPAPSPAPKEWPRAHLTLLLDAAILLTATEHDAVLLTANIRDFDLLLQLQPGARVLFYRPQTPALREPVPIG